MFQRLFLKVKLILRFANKFLFYAGTTLSMKRTSANKNQNQHPERRESL